MERLSMGATTTRRATWQHPPPQPAPKILHFPPRKPTRKTPKPKASPSKLPTLHNETKVMLVSLFDQERSFTREVVDPMLQVSPSNEEEMMRRERMVEEEVSRENNSVSFVEEEKWRLQAEILRAECNLWRMERDIAVKKMERRRVEVERTLKSAVQTLISARNNICERKNVRLVLEGQIDELLEKLEKLRKRSRVKDLDVKKCSNFDEQVCFLQMGLEGFGGFSEEEISVKQIRQMAEASLSIGTSCEGDESFDFNGNNYVEVLRRKMERLSKGVMLERMEEDYGSVLATTNSSATSSSSSSKRINYSDLSLSSAQQSYKEKTPPEAGVCSGHCKAIVQRLVKQVRAETEQWSQMQEMLGQAKEWKQRAISSETKANALQARISSLHEEIERLRNKRDRKTASAGNASPINQDVRNETEKRVLVCRVKENRCANDDVCKAQTCIAAGLLPQRSPLREMVNMSDIDEATW